MSKTLILSLLVILAALALHGLLRLGVQRLQQGKRVLPGALGRWLQPPEPGRYSELVWIHLCLVLALWVGVALLLARWWGWQQRSADWLRRLVDAGFDVAGFHIVPARLLLGLLLASILIGVARQLRVQLARKWRLSSHWEPGARESVATLISYAVSVLAILLGLGVAGFNLTNLAIVAGALSVGIGFGLQNIVNNFISGLILLSERPVRRGDYVQVGGYEGEVKQIHIRATEIETLDRVSVIVPNSDLISAPVLNWRLRDPYLRVVVTVGVAYGSDIEKVRDLLLEVGHNHESTFPDGTPGVPDTNVRFTNFGDSSLDFELRVFIRDVTQRSQVASDLRFAIDRAFRDNGVTIPFPQRDIWMRQDVGDIASV